MNRKTKSTILVLLAAFAMAACSCYPADVEQALKLAGDNRAELEKVLEHFGKRKEDKLKLQSAYFLISNMPYHYTVQDARLDSFRTYLSGIDTVNRLSWTSFQEEIYPSAGIIEKKQDLYHITSEFLISNIDFSFQVWQESPWGKYYSFDDFCEGILPYRLCNEPLENWKEKYYAIFRPLIDSIVYTHQPEEICLKLIQHLRNEDWTFAWNMDSQGFGASIMLEKRFGTCKEIAEFITYVLRSLGIPSGIDGYVQNPINTQRAHFWNYMHNTKGKHLSFDYYDDFHLLNGRPMARKYGKVYRQCYALQKESLPVKYGNKYMLLGGSREAFQKDVSFEYFPDTYVSIHLEPELTVSKDIVYLCVFNNSQWLPISWSFPKKGLAEFHNIEPDILYQLRMIDKTQNIAASKPFIFHSNENIQFPDADTTNLQLMILSRKFRVPDEWPWYAYRSVGGKFQGANKPDFSDSVTLHTIQEYADIKWEFIPLEDSRKYKYVRYLSATNGHNNMADVQFISDDKPLYGKVIGTDGSRDEFPNSDKHSVFDDDPLTFFDALEVGDAWAGLELDKAYTIDAIRYIFRNDDNNIRRGDNYELLYYFDNQWLSAGRQTADTTLLRYSNIPSNSLYWLRNHTRGKEERPFTYENGEQVWW